MADLVEDLARDRRFLHPIAVRDEGATGYRLIAGQHRLEAWKRHFGERQPIEAVVFPSHMPDARITLLDAGENGHRKDLTAAERQAGLLRYAAARKELEYGKRVTPVSDSGQGPKSGTASPSSAPARGGRGNKGMARKIAEKLGIRKRSVNRIAKKAAAAIGENIDLDHDTPEELERKAAELEKADKRQRAEPKVQRPKCRKPAPHGVVEDATPPAKPHAGETGNKIEVARKAFDALASKDQLRFIHDVCLHVGLDPLKMASPAVFGLTEEESELAVELPAEVALATDGAGVESQAEQGDEAAMEQAGQGEDAAELGAEDLQVADDDASEDADDHACNDADDDSSETADQEPAGATKCAYCNIKFESGDQLEEFNGQVFHAFCVEDGKRLAKAKQGKQQIAIAA